MTTGASKRKSSAQRKTATPWGPAKVIEQAKVAQRAGERRFASVVELLVRIAYSTGDTVRRRPVTLRARDLENTRAVLATRPRLEAALALRAGVVS